MDSKRNGWTPLHEAAWTGHLEALQVLIQAGAVVNVKDHHDVTPLHRAAFKGHGQMVTILIKAGAVVDAKDDAGWTPLHLAAKEGHGKLAHFLIDQGADVNAVDNLGHTPFYAHRLRSSERNEASGEVELAFLAAGANPNDGVKFGW